MLQNCLFDCIWDSKMLSIQKQRLIWVDTSHSGMGHETNYWQVWSLSKIKVSLQTLVLSPVMSSDLEEDDLEQSPSLFSPPQYASAVEEEDMNLGWTTVNTHLSCHPSFHSGDAWLSPSYTSDSGGEAPHPQWYWELQVAAAMSKSRVAGGNLVWWTLWSLVFHHLCQLIYYHT